MRRKNIAKGSKFAPGGIKLSVVVPIYNEAKNIRKLYTRLKLVLREIIRTSYEIILIDDGSRDNTYELLQELYKIDKHVRVIKFRRNFGQTAALSAGFDHARGEIIVTMDADLQNDPSDIPLLIERAEQGFDIVSGWRKHRKDTFITRKLPSLIANILISRLTGVKLHDYGCTLKAYKRAVVKNLRLYGELHRFIPALASLDGAKIAEIEVRHHPRMHGETKYGISRTLRVLLDLLTVEFLLRFSTRPMQIIGVFGLAAGFAGFCIALYLSILKLFFGASLANRPLLLLSVLLMVVGVQFVIMGLISELIIRAYYESADKKIYNIEMLLE